MKIIEVRDGFIKFEADKSVYLSSFVRIDNDKKSYIAQVVKLNFFGELSVASAKILFLYDNNELLNYDRTEPSKEAIIKPFTSDILKNSLNFNLPVIVGKTADNCDNIVIDADVFNKKILISVDEKMTNNIIVKNLSKQFLNLKKKIVIIDTLGILDAKKYVAGVDFKLPLDSNSLEFIYEACLNDATQDSKKTIIEIFKDLSSYSKTVPFLPFNVLKNIVTEMVDKEHVFKLLVLKNKLDKFEKLGYFASSPQEAEKINAILSSGFAVIDLSKLDTPFLNRYLSFIIKMLSLSDNTQVFVELSNAVEKKNLKAILKNKKVSAALITHSKFKYLSDIKNLFDNFIIEPSINNNTVFEIYTDFFKYMKKQTYLIAGEATNYIPFVSNTQEINDIIEVKIEEPIVHPDSVEYPIEQTCSAQIITADSVPEETKNEPENDIEKTVATEESKIDEELLESETEISKNNCCSEIVESEPTNEVEPDSDVCLHAEESELINEGESDSDVCLKVEELEEINEDESKDNNFIETEFSEQDNTEKPCLTQEEIIANIDKKSNNVIEQMAEELVLSQEKAIFDDEVEITENANTGEAEKEPALTEEVLLDNNENIQIDEQLDIESNQISNLDDVIVNITETDKNSSSEDIGNDELLQELELTDNNIAEENSDKTAESLIINSEQSEEVKDDSYDNIKEETATIYEYVENEETEDFQNVESVIEADEEEILLPIEDAQNLESEPDNAGILLENTNDNTTINDSDNLDEVVENESEDLIQNDEKTDDFIEFDEFETDFQQENSDEIDLIEEKQKYAAIESEFSEPQVLPININSESDNELNEVVELDSSEISDDDILVDITGEEESVNEMQSTEDIEQKIIEDVDKVYTTLKEENKEEVEEYSDSDLDLIDELNNDNNELEEFEGELDEISDSVNGILDESASKESIEAFNSEILEKRNSSTPIVPVYDADIPQEDIVMSDPIQQGDNVVHAKYGNGVVEKMIKYGNKTLFSINFVNIGRRLLDPTLTEIKLLK